MAATRNFVGGTLEGSAHHLAFRIGQAVEQTLVDRAVELAARDRDKSKELVVTADHIRRALDEAIIVDACAKIEIFINGKTKTRPSKSRAG